MDELNQLDKSWSLSFELYLSEKSALSTNILSFRDNTTNMIFSIDYTSNKILVKFHDEQMITCSTIMQNEYLRFSINQGYRFDGLYLRNIEIATVENNAQICKGEIETNSTRNFHEIKIYTSDYAQSASLAKLRHYYLMNKEDGTC